MNNGSMSKESNSSGLTNNDQLLSNLSSGLNKSANISKFSVQIENYRDLEKEMLTDDEDEHELVCHFECKDRQFH